jgi:hypothetical protein
MHPRNEMLVTNSTTETDALFHIYYAMLNIHLLAESQRRAPIYRSVLMCPSRISFSERSLQSKHVRSITIFVLITSHILWIANLYLLHSIRTRMNIF